MGQLSKAPREERAWVDAELAGDPDRLEDLGQDGIVGVVDRLVAEAAPGEAERLEERARRGRFASVQGRLDRTGQLYADGPLAEISAMWAKVAGEVARQDQLGRNGNNRDDDGGGGGSWRRAGRRNFDALYTLLTGRHIGGGHATLPHRPDRPAGTRLYVTVEAGQLASLSEDRRAGWPGRITDLCRGTVWLTPAARKALADDADGVLAAAVAGARIHTLGSESPTAHVGPALKAALLVRDGGCRAPGLLDRGRPHPGPPHPQTP